MRVVAATSIAFVLSVVPYRAMSHGNKLDQMNTELAKVNDEIAALKEDLSRRKRLVRALRVDTTAIENIARDELQMLYPHEKILRLDVSGRAK